jgi:hypothetical protein
MTLFSVFIRVIHIVLCVVIMYGVLLSESIAIQGVTLLALLLLVGLNHIYTGCELSQYERIDGFPSMSEMAKWIYLQGDYEVPLYLFERAVPSVLVFLLLVRAAALQLLPADWVYRSAALKLTPADLSLPVEGPKIEPLLKQN